MARTEARPPLWVGHITMLSHRLAESCALMLEFGMRPIFQNDEVAILELRGGTHLIILPCDEARSGAVPFDLMVEDVDATHRALQERGLEVSEISHNENHDWFTVRDPSGQDVLFNSTHVSDLPV